MTYQTIVAISDTHGMHRHLTIPDGDVLVHAGDLTRSGKLSEAAEFNSFLGELPHKTKIVIAGNHDWCFEREPMKARELLTNCVYLQDEFVIVDGVKYWGSPWQPEFCDWAFNLPRGEALKKKWDKIPNDTDVLITHGPPLGYQDITQEGDYVGCNDLHDAVMRVQPVHHIFGHVHEAYGCAHYDEMTFSNASSCDLQYRPVNKPIVYRIKLIAPAS